MKKTLFLFFMVALMAFAACTDGLGDNHEFIDQDVSGKVNGKDFEYQSGTARKDFYEKDKMTINLYQSASTDPCNEISIDGLKVFFTVPMEVGLYDLNSTQQSEVQLVNMYDPEGFNNFVASKGAIEITAIDTSVGTVEGKIDASALDDNSVNGNFIVDYCTD